MDDGFSTSAAVAELLESEGFCIEEHTENYIKKKVNCLISINSSVFMEDETNLHFTGWILGIGIDSFIMINYFIRTNKGLPYFLDHLDKYVKLVEKISTLQFPEYFYVIYCGQLMVEIEKETFENQNIFYLYLNIDSGYEDMQGVIEKLKLEG